MQAGSHFSALRRTGIVLLIVGLLDIGFMIYSIVNGMSYSSSLNIFAVIAGIFLIRGNLRAAAIVRWWTLCFAVAIVAVIVLSPLIVPVGLMYVEAKIETFSTVLSVVMLAGVFALFAWLTIQLRAPPVQAALAARFAKLRGPALPVSVGIGIAAVLAAASVFTQHTQSAKRAIAAAMSEHGSSYRYYVSSMRYQSKGAEETVSGVLTAWKDDQVERIPFGWQD
jgi:hypothetical protein